MPIGDYRVRITLQIRAVFQDEEGNIIEKWRDWKPVWAAIVKNPKQGGYAFQIRYFSEVPTRLRVFYLGKGFHVTNQVDVNGRHQQIILECAEVIEDAAD